MRFLRVSFMIFFRIALFTFLVWAAGFGWFYLHTAKETPKTIEKADAIIVFTGEKGRIDEGLFLLNNKNADELFISGVGKRTKLTQLSKHLSSFDPSRARALKDSITLGRLANSTKENVSESAEWIRKNNARKIILVTSNYHMQRSLMLFKRLLPEISIKPHPLAKPNTRFQLFFLDYNKFLWLYIT
jgi:uncharacterized SAM-binding protein YcdF (DUF218 family)